jgi:phosphoribosylaminoimidazolecarboxamide formyltransferase/IMP cyclohydrolase
VRRIERALISVFDKTGVVEFASGLAALGVEILATGSTARLLSSTGLKVSEVSGYTGFPEIMDGRVKTLHPRIAGGLLAVRANPQHMREAEQNGIGMIDLVCVNLYPFAETIKRPGVTFEETIENIDIGGPSMIRAAAKNFQDVAVVTSPEDYERVLGALRQEAGVLSRDLLLSLARKAFVCTARYDGLIAEHLSKERPDPGFPPSVFIDFERVQMLRYGENPHQKAAFYAWGGQPHHGLAAARLLQGSELSYNNLVDLDAAWNLAAEFEAPACCVIKHTNPCGAATGANARDAYLRAYAADPVSAFGSVIGFNRVVDGPAAEELAKLKIDAVIAPGFEPQARDILLKRKNLKLIENVRGAAGYHWAGLDLRRVSGGILMQEQDRELSGPDFRIASMRHPTEAELRDLDFAWRTVKHVKSNAIVLARDGCTAGVGAGQMSRVDSVRISVQKAGKTSNGCVLASDAFFPFRDGVDEAAAAGVTAIIQPGGSLRDSEIIEAVNEHSMAMVFTGLRHFKH